MTNQQFISLIKAGNVSDVKEAVTSGRVSLRDLEQNMDNEPSYLIAAIRTKNTEMVKMLLQTGANPEAVSYAHIDGPGTTPYHYTVKFFLDEYSDLLCLYQGSVPQNSERKKPSEFLEKNRYFSRYAPENTNGNIEKTP